MQKYILKKYIRMKRQEYNFKTTIVYYLNACSLIIHKRQNAEGSEEDGELWLARGNEERRSSIATDWFALVARLPNQRWSMWYELVVSAVDSLLQLIPFLASTSSPKVISVLFYQLTSPNTHHKPPPQTSTTSIYPSHTHTQQEWSVMGGSEWSNEAWIIVVCAGWLARWNRFLQMCVSSHHSTRLKHLQTLSGFRTYT